MCASQPARRSRIAAKRPLIEPPITIARRRAEWATRPFPRNGKLLYHRVKVQRRNTMALTMLDKKPVDSKTSAWPAEIAAEFERESKSPNGCVGQRLLSENERVRVWEI